MSLNQQPALPRSHSCLPPTNSCAILAWRIPCAAHPRLVLRMLCTGALMLQAALASGTQPWRRGAAWRLCTGAPPPESMQWRCDDAPGEVGLHPQYCSYAAAIRWWTSPSAITAAAPLLIPKGFCVGSQPSSGLQSHQGMLIAIQLHNIVQSSLLRAETDV